MALASMRVFPFRAAANETRFVRHKFMGWATPYIDKLGRGETVQFRPRGNSMRGKIESGQLCTVVPVNPDELKVGDIVLCKVNGYQYIHLIKARQGTDSRLGIIVEESKVGSG